MRNQFNLATLTGIIVTLFGLFLLTTFVIRIQRESYERLLNSTDEQILFGIMMGALMTGMGMVLRMKWSRLFFVIVLIIILATATFLLSQELTKAIHSRDWMIAVSGSILILGFLIYLILVFTNETIIREFEKNFFEPSRKEDDLLDI